MMTIGEMSKKQICPKALYGIIKKETSDSGT